MSLHAADDTLRTRLVPVNKSIGVAEVLAAAEVDATMGRLSTTSDVAAALAGVDFIIEAAPEKIDLKVKLFADIDAHAPASASRCSSQPGAWSQGIMRP